MKKFLSLVLALVMTMSLVTISAGAKTFEDDAAIDYNEAVEVMKAVGVIDGYADGSFNPSATLTRGAAAKIICNMILGPTNAGALAVTTAPFKDVPADNVFAGYISYCVSEGIISGYADGTFRPAGTLTGYAFMKMLLGALGYDTAVEGYTGNNWAVNVAKRALNIGLDDGLTGTFNGTKAVTREEACLYAFNTLKAPMVKYPTSSTITVGDIVISNNSKAEEITGTYTGLACGDSTKQEFAEKYFKDLKYFAAKADDYGRPAHVWKYDDDTVGTYVNDVVLTYTKGVKGLVMADDIDDAGYDVADTVNMTINSYYIEDDVASGFTGALAVNDTVPYTGAGVQFELYDTNDDDKVDNLVVIFTDVAKITSITQDKESTKSVDERAMSLTGTKFGSLTARAEKTATVCKTAGYKDVHGNVKVDDYVLVVPKVKAISNFAWNAATSYNVTSGVISMTIPETVSGVMNYKNTTSSTVKIEGTSYPMAYTFENDTIGAVSDKTVKAYMDTFGNVIMVDGVDTTSDKAIAVLDVYQSLNKDGKIIWMTKGVTSNGETVTWELKSHQISGQNITGGMVYEYTEDTSAGNYTLANVAAAPAGISKHDNGSTYKMTLDTATTTATKKICTYYAADDTSATTYTYFADTVNFIFVNGDKATVKEGVQKIAAGSELNIVINKDGEISTVFVIGAAKNSIDSTDSLIVIAKKTGTVSVKNTDTNKYETFNTYDAYVNGEKVEDFYAKEVVAAGSVYTNEKDTDTGAYVLTGNEYSDTNEDIKVVSDTLTGGTDTWFKNSKLFVVNSVDVAVGANTVFADNTTNEVTSLDGLKSAVAIEGNTVKVTALYDKDTAEALYVYVYAV